MLLLSVLSWTVSQAWIPHQLQLSSGTWNSWLSQASVHLLQSLCWCHWCCHQLGLLSTDLHAVGFSSKDWGVLLKWSKDRHTSRKTSTHKSAWNAAISSAHILQDSLYTAGSGGTATHGSKTTQKWLEATELVTEVEHIIFWSEHNPIKSMTKLMCWLIYSRRKIEHVKRTALQYKGSSQNQNEHSCLQEWYTCQRDYYRSQARQEIHHETLHQWVCFFWLGGGL